MGAQFETDALNKMKLQSDLCSLASPSPIFEYKVDNCELVSFAIRKLSEDVGIFERIFNLRESSQDFEMRHDSSE